MSSNNAETQPLITIGMTCFNGEKTVLRAIQSALSQTWENKEIVIVDDASNDNSVNVIKSFIKDYDFIRLIALDRNIGMAGAINRIIAEAKGEYLALFDDDDVSFPNRLIDQYTRIKEFSALHPATPCICFGNRIVTSPDSERHAYGVGRFAPEPYGDAVIRKFLFLKRAPEFCWGEFGSGAMMAITRFLIEAGGFDPRFRRNSEADLFIRAATLGCRFISVDKDILRQYVTANANKTPFRKCRNRFMILFKHKTYLFRNRLVIDAMRRYFRYCKKQFRKT